MAAGGRDLEGQLVVVTGATSGIGRATAEALASRGATVVLACRSEPKTKPVLEGIAAAGGDARFMPLDLGDFESVRACAEQLRQLGRPIDVLVANAGLAAPGRTKSGFELVFGTNHLGHFLLTVLSAPALVEARAARVVVVSSRSHYDADGIDFDVLTERTRSITALPEYAVSKLANVLFARELAKRLAGTRVRTYSLHPGVVATDAWRRIPWPLRSIAKWFMLSNEDGAKTSIHCATSPEVASETGRYYDRCRDTKPSPLALDDDLARELWERSAAWTGADLRVPEA